MLFRSVSSVLVKKMTDAISHRGPDSEGQWTEGAIGLGHRRLAIIDLTPAGHQPMISTNSRYVISYNGEVYNFQELRAELESKGYWFHSRTDTEVVLNAYSEWGVECLNRFNGMFAFSIWDRKEKILTLARDRYGIKPLYYTIQDHLLLFSSEIKGILAYPEYRPALDKEALLEYFTFQNFFTSRTLHKDIHTLPAGHYLQLNLDKAFNSVEELGPVQYWDYDFREPDTPLEEQEYVDAIKQDLSWMGFKWDKECYSSDYFQQLYDWAVLLIKKGKAYVDSQSSERSEEHTSELQSH